MLRMMRWVRQLEEKRNAYRLSVGKPEGKRPLGRPRHRWVDNIVEPLGSIKCWETIEWPYNWGLSSGAQLHRVHSFIHLFHVYR
jgi:hypothetical protein